MSNKIAKTQWKYLETRPESWRKQLYIKGRKLRANTVWSDMLVNRDSIEEASDNWGLPVEALKEVIHYCETHRDLLRAEAESERRYLEDRGVVLEPKVAN